MDKKGSANLVLIVLVIVLAGVVGYFALNNRSATPTPTPSPAPTSTLSPTPTPAITPTPPISLRICPEQWYVNRMPSAVGQDGVPKEYFIYKGGRRELSEFDLNWVKTNCPLKLRYVN